MQPKNKIRTLIFGLVLPYMALVMYFALRIQEHPLPTWFPYFGLSYMLGSIIVVIAFSRKIARGVPPQAVQKPWPALRFMLRAWAGYLILVWCALFLWGAYQTIIGHLDWKRALPAGAFLVAVMGLFGRLLYSDMHKTPNRTTNPTQENTTNTTR